MQQHWIRKPESLGTDSYGYRVFYPSDGYLSAEHSTLWTAEEYLQGHIDEFPDAYVVRVQIERVEA